MARIEYIQGVQCKQCGTILQGGRGAEITLSTPELCQNCGAHLIDKHMGTNSFELMADGQSVIIKATHKLFSTIYEVVREV